MPALDLAKVNDVLAYLEGTPFKSHTATPLVGGYGNYTYRIHLRSEYKGKTSAILKHGKLHVPGMSLAFSLDRQIYEVEALRQVREWLPEDSLVTVPEVYHFDKPMGVIIMSDCGAEVVTLKQYLMQETPVPTALSTSIGTALGRFIGELHSHWKDARVLRLFDGNVDGRKLYAFVTYGCTLSTLRGDHVPPALTDPLLDIPEQTLTAIADVAREMTDKILTARETVIMGDFWPGNVLVDVRRDERGDAVVQRVYVIDWEMAKPGLAGLDIGQFCAELELVRQFNAVNRDAAGDTISAFCRAYSARCGGSLDVARTAAVHIGAHLATWTPRIPTWTGKEKVREVVREGVEYLVKGNLASEEYISKSLVSGLLGTKYASA